MGFGYSEKNSNTTNRIIEVMIDDSKKALRELTKHLLMENYGYLSKIGYLPVLENDIPLPSNEIETFVDNLFIKIDSDHLTGQEIGKILESKEYREIVRLLVLCGIVVPNIAADWKVNRHCSIENVGLEISELETLYVEKYPHEFDDKDPHFRTLEKGMGNGEGQIRRIDANKVKPKQYQFEQVGIADKIYYPIEEVLKKIMKSDYLGMEHQSFIDLLGLAIRNYLKEEWFDNHKQNVIEKWSPRAKIFDLNIIYDFFLNPRSNLERWYEKDTGNYSASEEFEFDCIKRMDLFDHYLFMKLSGYKEEFIKEIQDKIVHENHLKNAEQINKYVEISETLKALPQEELEKDLDEWVEKVCNITKKTWRKKDYPKKADDLICYMENALKTLRVEIYNQEKQENEKLEQLRSNNSKHHGREYFKHFIEKFFTPEFANALLVEKKKSQSRHKHKKSPHQKSRKRSKPLIDLNTYPKVYFANNVVDDFENLTQYFPPQSVNLILEIRSTSHLPDPEYIEDLKRTLNLLKPGGCLVSDGIKASFNRVLRADDIYQVLKNNKEFKAEVITDENGKIYSLFIQRAHPYGFLSDEDKKRILNNRKNSRKAPDRKFLPLEKLVSRPDLRIINAARKEIKAIFPDNDECFRGMHEEFETCLIRSLEKKYLPSQPSYKESIKLLDKFRKGKIEVSDKEIQELIDDLRTEIYEKICNTKLESKKGLANLEIKNPNENTIYTFPNKNIPEIEDSNQRYRYNSKNLPDNSELLNEKQISFLKNSEMLLRKEYTRLKNLGIEHPFSLLSFTDCATNDLLLKMVEDIIQDDVYHIPVRFNPMYRGGYSAINNLAEISQVIKKLTDNGGVLIGGGSWQDSYTEPYYLEKIEGALLEGVYGKYLDKKIDGETLHGANEHADRFRMFNICFSAQTFADMLGKVFFEGSLKTKPGTLEIGPTPVRIPKEGKNHPWLKGFPQRLTFATTHSGHVVTDLPSQRDTNTDPELRVRVLVRSEITGLPLAWSTCKGHVLSSIIHPEINLVDGNGGLSPDIKPIQSQIESAAHTIRRKFNSETSLIRHNWSQILDEKKVPRIKANAGRLLLVRGLYYLARTIR